MKDIISHSETTVRHSLYRVLVRVSQIDETKKHIPVGVSLILSATPEEISALVHEGLAKIVKLDEVHPDEEIIMSGERAPKHFPAPKSIADEEKEAALQQTV